MIKNEKPRIQDEEPDHLDSFRVSIPGLYFKLVCLIVLLLALALGGLIKCVSGLLAW